MTAVAPFILNHPRITLDAGGTTPIDIECSANEVHTNVDQDENTTDTFCGSYTTYKPEVWDLTVNAIQSFGPDGLWTRVRPLVGTVVDVELLPDSTIPVGPTNPIWYGPGLVKAFPFIDGAIGEASEFDLVIAMQGIPQTSETDPVTATASTTSANTPEPEPVPA